ncbi:Similar to S.cerevisiae protein COX13 (Subunit VIa of cytochrome c oxidase) [Malassezia sympodialis ATCC 42132]|uniref:Similar to S.cerevisiae protein COX13 (Subunit VIa of cytochrome c oxidase) n=1 Tax=Malassezia sympodialis (strain ATCC 42132) TaxID=1230383 RepID=A0A1M8A7C9_MALS4|nr:Similar to S.cerevisiae protein COX13 (Subunit VIa of cytochrome c oxidase) [Malassezia sympodialis ATCC 42132]
MAAFRAVIPRSAALRPRQPVLRRFNSSFTPDPEAAKAFVEARKHAFEHAAKSTSMWRNISLFVLIPGAAVLGAYMYKVEAKHAAHQAHILEENGGELPERPDYEYLNIKNKKFPWGQQSLFFNPKVNYPSQDM